MAALALLIPITIFTELRDGKIYNWLTLPVLGLGLMLAGLDQMSEEEARMSFGASAWGALVGGGMFFIPYVISGLSRGVSVVGGGDVKFSASVGALMGPWFVIWTVYYAVITGTVLGIGTILWRKYRARGTAEAGGFSLWTMRIPFGTALCLGVMLALTKGKF